LQHILHIFVAYQTGCGVTSGTLYWIEHELCDAFEQCALDPNSPPYLLLLLKLVCIESRLWFNECSEWKGMYDVNHLRALVHLMTDVSVHIQMMKALRCMTRAQSAMLTWAFPLAMHVIQECGREWCQVVRDAEACNTPPRGVHIAQIITPNSGCNMVVVDWGLDAGILHFMALHGMWYI